MKIFMALSLFVSSFAIACPDLTGKFRCVYPNKVTVSTISVRQENGNYVYNVDGSDYIADGKSHSLDDGETVKKASYIYSCNGEYLKQSFKGQVYDEGSHIANMKVNGQTYISSKNVIEDGVVTYTILSSGNTYNENYSYTCTRL